MDKRFIPKIGAVGAAILAGMPTTVNPETQLEKINRAKFELVINGVTSEQQGAHIFGVNDLLYNTISPRAYTTNSYAPRGPRVADEIADKKPIEVTLAIINRIIDGLKQQRIIETNEREDAWRMYLGKPQIHGTFEIADYFPRNSKDNTYYYKFKNPFFLLRNGLDSIEDRIRRIVNTLEATTDGFLAAKDTVVLNDYQWSKGKDDKGNYIAYYDNWDLNVPLEKKGFFGRSLEVYGRIYYNPVTYEVISH